MTGTKQFFCSGVVVCLLQKQLNKLYIRRGSSRGFSAVAGLLVIIFFATTHWLIYPRKFYASTARQLGRACNRLVVMLGATGWCGRHFTASRAEPEFMHQDYTPLLDFFTIWIWHTIQRRVGCCQGCSPKKEVGDAWNKTHTKILKQFRPTYMLYWNYLTLRFSRLSNQLQQWTNVCTNFSPKK